MQLATFEIPPGEAAAKLAEYEAMLQAERTTEDEAIARGYRAAARGLPVISLPATIIAGGFFEDGLPKIAICPADATECFVRWESGWNRTSLIFADRDDWNVNRGALVGAHSVRIGIPGDDRPPVTGRGRGSTLVPLIPPAHRPRKNRLRRRHILWEVEEWTWTPPRDPALLQHIRGDLWSVLAVWDLTDLERYVLTQRTAR
jgi:hypothetical protein